MAALLFVLKCHTAEKPSKGHGEELQQTEKALCLSKPLQFIFQLTYFFQVVASRQEMKA